MDHQKPALRKNPSREACENIIKRILMTEILEKGKNEHFRTAADFMDYFESLYPPSDGLTKQVQRAVKSLNMPKDELGYFIPNKTVSQLEAEKEFAYLFSKADAAVFSMEDYRPLFLKTNPEIRAYLLHAIENSPVFKGKFLTAHETAGGILFYTKTPSQLEVLLNSLIVR